MLEKENYFEEAHSWFHEQFESEKVKVTRLLIALGFVSVFALLALVADILLLPLKTWVPMIIHTNAVTGEAWVQRPSEKTYVPETEAQVQSDLVRYVTQRESYMSADINQRYKTVLLLSHPSVAKQYSDEQANSNKSAPVNVLGKEGIRTISIEDIVFLDKAGVDEVRHFNTPSRNLAKVDFVVTTEDEQHQISKAYWVATMSWQYKGEPTNKEAAWDNWNGFQVTSYRADLRNISTKKTA